MFKDESSGRFAPFDIFPSISCWECWGSIGNSFGCTHYDVTRSRLPYLYETRDCLALWLYH